MTVAKPLPNSTDFVALIYLPRIQDTSLQTLAGAEQRAEGEQLGKRFRAFSVNIICQHSPVWLLNDARKSVGESQGMIPTSVPTWHRERWRCTILKIKREFFLKQKRETHLRQSCMIMAFNDPVMESKRVCTLTFPLYKKKKHHRHCHHPCVSSSREQPIFSARAHVFQIDPTTKRNWIPASKHAVTVSFFYDANRNVYRIISVGGTKVRGRTMVCL